MWSAFSNGSSRAARSRLSSPASAATMFCAVILHPSSTMNTAISTHIPSTIPFFTPLFSSHPGDTGRVEQGLEQAQRYVRYVAASGETWERTFRLLEEYEQDTAQYRAGVAEIAALLEEWNGRNLGRIELDGQAQAFVERMAG